MKLVIILNKNNDVFNPKALNIVLRNAHEMRVHL